MYDTIKDRLKLIMFENKMSQVAFAKAINMTPPSLSRMLNSASDPSINTLQKIATAFGITLGWIMTGKGEKYETDGVSAEEPAPVKDDSTIHKTSQHTPSFQDLIQRIQAVEEENRRLKMQRLDYIQEGNNINNNANNLGEPILLVDAKSAITYPDKTIDKDFLSALPAFSLPFTRFRNGSFRAFEIPGEAMSKRINRGDWVICQRVENFNAIRDSYVYVIVLEDELLCRRLINRIDSRGRIRLKADNPSFSDYEVEIEQVKEVWEVKSVMGFDLSNPDFQLQSWVKHLEDKLFELNDRIERVERKSK